MIPSDAQNHPRSISWSSIFHYFHDREAGDKKNRIENPCPRWQGRDQNLPTYPIDFRRELDSRFRSPSLRLSCLKWSFWGQFGFKMRKDHGTPRRAALPEESASHHVKSCNPVRQHTILMKILIFYGRRRHLRYIFPGSEFSLKSIWSSRIILNDS